jgi:hypothetical protein
MNKLWCDHFIPQSRQFEGNNIRLDSTGDIYCEYLLKVWLQQGGVAYNENSVTYLWNMYEEAMGGVMHLLVKTSKPSSLVFVGELPNGPNGVVHPKMDHLVCYTFLVQSYIGEHMRVCNWWQKWQIAYWHVAHKKQKCLGGWGILCNKLAYFWVYGSSLINHWEKVQTFDIDMVIIFCRCAS